MSTQETNLKAIADAIREKDGTSAAIPASKFPARIRTLQVGMDTSDATAAAADILSAKTAYIASGKVTGTMPTKNQAIPSISVSSSGLITASAVQETGYVKGGTQRATKQLSTQAAQTITPGIVNQSIYAGKYLTGTQTIRGDANLTAENIKAGVSIFNVTGTFSGKQHAFGYIDLNVEKPRQCSYTIDGTYDSCFIFGLLSSNELFWGGETTVGMFTDRIYWGNNSTSGATLSNGSKRTTISFSLPTSVNGYIALVNLLFINLGTRYDFWKS